MSIGFVMVDINFDVLFFPARLPCSENLLPSFHSPLDCIAYSQSAGMNLSIGTADIPRESGSRTLCHAHPFRFFDAILV